MLSYISSYLASRPRTPSLSPSPARAPEPASGGSGGAGSGAVALRGEEQMWEVRWEDLEVERAIGRGSFGWVYVARWNQIQVVSVAWRQAGWQAAPCCVCAAAQSLPAEA